MTKWRYTGDDDDLDEFQKTDKMRKKPSVLKSKQEVRLQFEIEEEKWAKQLEEDCFAARVVEVHKGYVFVSSEPKVGKVDTRDVWLGTIARMHLQARREERNFVCVGDRVLCKRGEKGSVEIKSDLPQCQILHM